MDSPQKFQRSIKFPAGNKVKKTSKLLKGKNKLLKAISTSESNGSKPNRRNCCHY
jgi:hypothetical protein